MADSHRSALRPRGRPRGRHARLIVRCSTREFPVAMGPLRPVWAARRARWSHAISDALAVSRARIRGGRGGRLIGRCLLCSQVRRERSSGGSTRAAHETDPELKGGGVPLATRRGCSRGGSTKKRADLGSSCHVGHGSATLVVGPTEIKKLRKSGLTSPTEKPAQTRRRIFF